MQLNQVAEAIQLQLWMPGLEQASTIIAADADALLHNPVSAPALTKIGLVNKPSPPAAPKAVWPQLQASTLDVGGIAAKFAANIAAIKALKAIEADGRNPTAEEALTLTQFTGWGGMPQAFKEEFNAHSPSGQEWAVRAKQVREVLTDAEHAAAVGSTLNAHYTSHEVITAMWQAVERLGFKGGRVLEPGCGAGYFIGAMPTTLAQRSTVTAVELDSVTARIAKALYGQYGVKVINEGLEKTKLPDGFFDLVIGNVPFGNYKVHDTEGRWQGASIHNYFLLRALEMTRPGGLVAVISGSYTLDSQNTKWRLEMAKLGGQLVAAIRLPHTAFKAIANTEVTTDVLIFQRTRTPMFGEWAGSLTVAPKDMLLRDEHIVCNPYLATHPEQVIGKLAVTGRYPSPKIGVVFDGDLSEALAERVSALPQGIVPKRDHGGRVPVAPRRLLVASSEWVKPGAYVVTKDGHLARSVDGERLEVVSGTTAKDRRVRAIIPVRDALRKLLAVQAATEDDTTLERYQVALAGSYAAFVKEFGYISKPFNCSAYRDDPDFPLLLSLEHWDSEEQTATKADVFTKRTVGVVRQVERCETPEDALLVCLSEYARVVPERIGALLTLDADEATALLLDKGLIFADPISRELEEASAYLSGDVKTKLAVAKAAGDAFLGNVSALEAVIPADIASHDIGTRLGATWIPAEIVREWVCSVLETSEARANYDADSATWTLSRAYGSYAARQKYGTARVEPTALIELALNQKSARVTDPDPKDPEGKRRVVNTVQTVNPRRWPNWAMCNK